MDSQPPGCGPWTPDGYSGLDAKLARLTRYDLKCLDTESSITTGYAGSPTIDGCSGF